MTKKEYVSVIYDEKRTPRSDYPYKLASYLKNRFGIDKGAKLLEVGCGRGDFMEAFCFLEVDCSGVDLCSYDSKKEGVVKRADVSKDKLPYADESFDVVYHKSLIEHIADPSNLMEESRRVLKPGGRLIILTPDWVSQMKVFYEDFTHTRPYDRTSLRDLLDIYGFCEIETELFYQLPVVWKYPVVKAASRMVRLFIDTPKARKLASLTNISFFRWSVELMVLAAAVKK